jgi:hypothetical protein
LLATRIEPFGARRVPTLIRVEHHYTMSRPGFICLAFSALLLAAGCSQLDRRARTSESGGQQILIMIKEAQVEHYRPGADFISGYGGPRRASARRAAEAVAAEHGLRVVDEWAMPALGVRCFVAELPAGRAAEPVLESLNADARVEWAQAVNLFRVLRHDHPYSVAPRSATRSAPRDRCWWLRPA